ncbi:hypothetical protein I308_101686 [Cryptococcus tetragattii IND107]|uniref:DUF4460 domain-containing protein n=1 Tax=Cryptococcus tetragattii IND107 TaxID=1296105 RepID=A0ABR3BV79_9TREE
MHLVFENVLTTLINLVGGTFSNLEKEHFVVAKEKWEEIGRCDYPVPVSPIFTDALSLTRNSSPGEGPPVQMTNAVEELQRANAEIARLREQLLAQSASSNSPWSASSEDTPVSSQAQSQFPESVRFRVPQAGFARGKTWKESTFVQRDLFTRLMQDRHPDLFSREKITIINALHVPQGFHQDQVHEGACGAKSLF